MRLVTAPHIGGKTRFLVDQLHRNPRLLLCVPTFQARDFVTSRWPDIANRIVTYQQVKDGVLAGWPGDTEIVVDEVQRLLQLVFSPFAVGDMTATMHITELNPQVISHIRTNDAGQKYMLPPPEGIGTPDGDE